MKWRFFLVGRSFHFFRWIRILFISSLTCANFLFPLTEGWGNQTDVPHTTAVEFSARLVWKTRGHVAKAQLFVTKDRYRIEPLGGVKTELGYAGVMIVRLDEKKVWLILSQRRMVLSIPLTAEYLLPFSVKLQGEISRSLIGDSMVGNRSALLYEVEVEDQSGQTERYFEWVDAEKNILLKLLSKDRDWFVEYHHVVLSPQPDYYFEAPLGYRVVEVQKAHIPKGGEHLSKG